MNEKTQENVGNDLTEGNIFKQLIVFVVPLLLANLLQQLYNVVDTIIAGQYIGTIGTVGVSTGGEIAAMITFVAVAFGSASQIYIAQLSGSKDEEKIKDVIGTVISLTLLIGAVCMLACILLCEQILSLLNCPSEALGQAEGYMIVVSIGLPFVFGYNTLCGIMRGMGESKRPLYFAFIATFANIFLDIILVIIFPLEAVGTAIATVIAQVFSFMAAAIFILKNKDIFGIDLKLSYFKMRRVYLIAILKLGIPLSAQSLFIHFSQLICTSFINTFGLTASATNSIGNRIQKFITVFMTSVNNGAGAMVGQNIGAKKYDRVKRIVYITMLLSGGVCILAILLALCIPDLLFALFTTDSEVIELGVVYMHICIITFIATALQGGYMAVVTGTGNATLNLVAGILDGIVLRLGISFLLAYVFDMGVVGFFYGNAWARFASVVVGGIYYYSGRWKNFNLLKEDNN